MMNVDIPQLSLNGIQLEKDSFFWTRSVQASRIRSILFSSFDASGFEQYICFSSQIPSGVSSVIKNQTELDSLSVDAVDLWIQLFDTTGLTSVSFNQFQSLRSLVIGNNLFWSVSAFHCCNLPSLQTLHIGRRCFSHTASFSLTGVVKRVE